MLESTFCHIPSIGPKAENALWDGGVTSWSQVAEGADLPLSPARADRLRHHCSQSLSRLSCGDAAYFYARLPTAQHWRMFPEFRGSVAYLDIETTGLGQADEYITLIGLYDGRRLRHYVRDENLLDFRHDIAEYRLIVTYNGKTFDLPFIRRTLGLRMNQAHIDLRYPLRSLGYRGGLKACERGLGIARKGLEDVDGFLAVLLWHDFVNAGNEKARQTLLAYNALDTVHLERLCVLAYNGMLARTPFSASRRLPLPALPPVPFRPDRATIERLRRVHGI